MSSIVASGFILDIRFHEELQKFVIVGGKDLGAGLRPFIITFDLSTFEEALTGVSPSDSSWALKISTPPLLTPPTPTTFEPDRLVRDPWDIDEWGRFYPGAGYHRITKHAKQISKTGSLDGSGRSQPRLCQARGRAAIRCQGIQPG
jgi:hypothetical protein